jgi:orotidine-5'-phosphate decarboxylase
MKSPKVIVALDFNQLSNAEAFVEQVTPADCRLKVGKELFCLAGPEYVKKLVKKGFDVFLDLKFHDIPNTVEGACRAVADLGVWMVNVHCSGGKAMLEAALRGVKATRSDLLLTGVTVLTSHNDETLSQLGFNEGIEATVKRWAAMAHQTGLDGVVCSVQEVAAIRSVTAPNFQLVTPGIRPADADRNDQQRCATPVEAIQRGANHLVIGRPITRSADPLGQLQLINQEIRSL